MICRYDNGGGRLYPWCCKNAGAMQPGLISSQNWPVPGPTAASSAAGRCAAFPRPDGWALSFRGSRPPGCSVRGGGRAGPGGGGGRGGGGGGGGGGSGGGSG